MAVKTKPTTFAARLRAAIDRKQITRAELAQRAGLGRDTVQKLLAGSREPGAETVAALCRALDASADELLGLKWGVSGEE